MKKKLKLEDLFEIEYDEYGDPDWFIIRAKPEFAKHRMRIEPERARLDIHHSFKGEEAIQIRNGDHEEFPEKFNSIYLEKYDKSPEQGYWGRGEIYVTVKEVKKEAK